MNKVVQLSDCLTMQWTSYLFSVCMCVLVSHHPQTQLVKLGSYKSFERWDGQSSRQRDHYFSHVVSITFCVLLSCRIVFLREERQRVFVSCAGMRMKAWIEEHIRHVDFNLAQEGRGREKNIKYERWFLSHYSILVSVYFCLLCSIFEF